MISSIKSFIKYYKHPDRDIIRQFELYKYLIQKQINEPLIMAIIDNQKIKHIKLLIDIVAEFSSLNIRNIDGDTAISIAVCDIQNIDIVNTLINAGADLNIQYFNDMNLLMLAIVLNDNSNIAKSLIYAGIDLNIKDYHGQTALMFAQIYNMISIVQLLINKGANVNIQDGYGDTILIRAIRENKNIEYIKLLIDAGANLNIHNYKQHTAMDISITMENLVLTNLLFHRGGRYPVYILNIILDNIKECPVCYISFTIRNIYMGKLCGHPVCYRCLDNINKCPICRNIQFK